MARLKKLTAFTFIELVIAVGLMAIISLFIAGGLNNLRNISRRVSRKQLVKNEGDHILEVITRMARSGRPLDCSSDQYFTIINPDGGLSRFLFKNNSIASRSAPLGEDIDSSTQEETLNDSQVKVTEFHLDCSHFIPHSWGNWLKLKFKLEDTLKPSDPIEMNFESGISFRNR